MADIAQEVVQAIFDEAAADRRTREFVDSLRETYERDEWSVDTLLRALAAAHRDGVGSD